MNHSVLDAAVNDQHRRVTQILFTPVCTAMRADARFMPLCERMGLAEYWAETRLPPDFLNPDP